MQYGDLNYESLTGQYRREHGQNPGEHVHPVIAAMFLPKIDVLEHPFFTVILQVLLKHVKTKIIKNQTRL